MFRYFVLISLALFLSGCNSMPAQVPTASAAKDVYRLHPGDVLEIAVWKEEGLAREIIVAPDGCLTFPLVGQIKVDSLSVTELEKVITERLSEYIPQPSVSVVLKAAAGSKFYVIGKVNRPGEFSLLYPVSVLQALSLAGGMSTFADSNEIRVIRNEGSEEKTYGFNYGEIARGKALEQNILLKSGDVVIVP